MPDIKWEWSSESKRYRDKDTGQFLSASSALELRDDFVARQREAMAELGRRLGAEEITIQRFERDFRERIRLANVTEYVYGRGGQNAMTPSDREALAELVKDQWQHLNKFTKDVQAGSLSPARIEARAKLYGGAGTTAYERGRMAAHVGLRLPALPAQGTDCKAACKCSWSIEEDESEWRCTWVRHASDSCETCVSRASQYSPYVQSKTERMLRVVEAA